MKKKDSDRFELSREDIGKLFKSLLLSLIGVVVGAVYVWLGDLPSTVEIGIFTPLVPFVVNVLRKLIVSNAKRFEVDVKT